MQSKHTIVNGELFLNIEAVIECMDIAIAGETEKGASDDVIGVLDGVKNAFAVSGLMLLMAEGVDV